MKLTPGKLVEHRGTGLRARFVELEEWPDGTIKCLWLREPMGESLDVSPYCWRRFWRPVTPPSARAR